MTIQEAIKAAGPGGEVKRWKWAGCESIKVGEDWTIKNRAGNRVYVDHGMLFADDWQVVTPEPDIEVGDVVKGCHTGEGCMIAKQTPNVYILHGITDEDCCCTMTSVNLIRKGKRHVFERVRVHISKGPSGMCLTLDSRRGKYPDGYIALADNDKTYTMTLEEVEDAKDSRT